MHTKTDFWRVILSQWLYIIVLSPMNLVSKFSHNDLCHKETKKWKSTSVSVSNSQTRVRNEPVLWAKLPTKVTEMPQLPKIGQKCSQREFSFISNQTFDSFYINICKNIFFYTVSDLHALAVLHSLAVALLVLVWYLLFCFQSENGK